MISLQTPRSLKPRYLETTRALLLSRSAGPSHKAAAPKTAAQSPQMKAAATAPYCRSSQHRLQGSTSYSEAPAPQDKGHGCTGQAVPDPFGQQHTCSLPSCARPIKTCLTGPPRNHLVSRRSSSDRNETCLSCAYLSSSQRVARCIQSAWLAGRVAGWLPDWLNGWQA